MINEKKGRNSDNCTDRMVPRLFLVFLLPGFLPFAFSVPRFVPSRSSLFERGRVRDRCLSARTGLANRKRFLLESLEANSVSETSR